MEKQSRTFDEIKLVEALEYLGYRRTGDGWAKLIGFNLIEVYESKWYHYFVPLNSQNPTVYLSRLLVGPDYLNEIREAEAAGNFGRGRSADYEIEGFGL